MSTQLAPSAKTTVSHIVFAVAIFAQWSDADNLLFHNHRCKHRPSRLIKRSTHHLLARSDGTHVYYQCTIFVIIVY